jgi:hypothetical protein
MAKAANKTQPTQASVEGYVAAIDDAARRQDCRDLIAVMQKATQFEPQMWGPSIVGFGSYHYKYDSGREGDSCIVGFSSRKGDISLYLVSEFDGREELLAKLGKHKTAKGCVYVRRMVDVDAKVLEKLIAKSAAQRKKNHAV